jgi:hypothetical protein
MSLTRREVDEVLSRGRIFCDLVVVAYFLGVSRNQASYLYTLGKLPKVLAVDGTEWRPSSERLVLVAKFAEMVAAERRSEFEMWRRGGFDVTLVGTREPATLLDHSIPESVALTDLVTVNR